MEVLMSDGFHDFTFGEGDKNLGRKSKKFNPEAGKSYNVSFVWYKGHNADGTPDLKKGVRFVSCERIYKEGVGYILYKSPAYAEFGTPRTAISTIIALWPSTRDGHIDHARLNEVEILPWIFSTDKYEELTRNNSRFPLVDFDYLITCTDSKFKKLSFTPDRECMMATLRNKNTDKSNAFLKSIYSDVEATANNIRRELARDLSLDEIREKLGMDVAAPTNRSSGDADSLLDDLV